MNPNPLGRSAVAHAREQLRVCITDTAQLVPASHGIMFEQLTVRDFA